MIDFITSHWGVIATMLLGISEVIALVPGVKANSIFQAIVNFLQSATKPKSV
jgi:hypothetical protein